MRAECCYSDNVCAFLKRLRYVLPVAAGYRRLHT